MLSNIYAWVISVLFAYITNKLFVFSSKSLSISTLARELVSFISCRLLSGVLDMTFMYVFVSLLNYNDFIIKTLSNIFVIIINYFLSKFLVFKGNSLNDKLSKP